tara:strand:+ start:536 stop:1657 length:1122 start_codon:yes stop_codon:yes gene_type:complete
MDDIMRILVTGADGFIGKNLTVHLDELDGVVVHKFVRGDTFQALEKLVNMSDAVIHLAGENRPENPDEFEAVNVGLTAALCLYLENASKDIPVVFASSAQAVSDNPYGRSKSSAEVIFRKLAEIYDAPIFIYRLPGVFGKWSKPNYNSVVATFCYNIANDLPITISNPATQIDLVYIDEVVSALVKSATDFFEPGIYFPEVTPVYNISLGELETQIFAFGNCRTSLVTECVGTGLIRALYSTYVSYLPKSEFSYTLPSHEDDRGIFVEMLKTVNSGQFSFFTAHPGITRGGHYHHSKTEKFLVIKGTASFAFKHILSQDLHTIVTSSGNPTVVETIPGWAHDITNIGDDDLVVMLWANEIFSKTLPDTIAYEI